MIGVDYDSSLIEYANYNFNLLENNYNQYEFYSDDMRSFVENNKNINADVFILPSVIYYINQIDFISFLVATIENSNLKDNIPFYIRIRTPKDFRYGLGKRIEKQTYQLPSDIITGEGNASITFYTELQIIDILKKYLNIRDFSIFHVDNQNEHNGEIILNSDVVIWGTIN